MQREDRRVIEDCLPIQGISVEASRGVARWKQEEGMCP